MTRKILIIPSILLFLGALFSATGESRLDFWLWLFGFLLSCLILLPVAFSFDDKKVPVFQIFFLIFVFFIFFARLAFWDFLSLGLKTNEALLYGMGTSVGLLVAIALVHGITDPA